MSLSSHHIKLVVLLAALLLHIGISVFVTQPGRVNGDEGVYHMMVYNLAEHGRFSMPNGLDDLPSRELRPLATQIVDGQIVPQYPHVFALLALPFYWLAGFKGLFYLNAMAFAASAALVVGLARRIYRDDGLALNAGLLFVFATFAWQYSQAAWPHSISVLFALSGFFMGYLSLREPQIWRATAYGVVAGAMFGLGIGMRLDTLFVMPASVLAYFLLPRVRLLPPLAMFVGMVPPLLLLAWTNLQKFGVFSAFSYGEDNKASAINAAAYYPLLLVGLGCFIGLWIATRPTVAARLRPMWKWLVPVAIAIIGATVLLVPEIQAATNRLILGLHSLLIDMRAFPVEKYWARQWYVRGEAGEMWTPFQGWKKALLQSMPYLSLLIVPAVMMFRRAELRLEVFVFFAAIAASILPYAYLVWHGGSPLNMRYFLTALPFAAILCADAWRELWAGEKLFSWPVVTGAALAATVSFIWLATLGASTALGGPIVYLTPLVIAAALCVAIAASLLSPVSHNFHWRRVAAAMAIFGFAWAGVIAFLYDYPKVAILRYRTATLAEFARQNVEPPALVFLPRLYPFANYFEADDVRYAAPIFDDYADFPTLADINIKAGRNVYLWTNPATDKDLEEKGSLAGLSLTPLGKVLGEELVQLKATGNN